MKVISGCIAVPGAASTRVEMTRFSTACEDSAHAVSKTNNHTGRGCWSGIVFFALYRCDNRDPGESKPGVDADRTEVIPDSGESLEWQAEFELPAARTTFFAPE